MKRLRAALLRLAGGLGLTRPDTEITEELRSHLEMLVDEYRRRGLRALDPPALAAAVVFLTAITGTAAYLPARRALAVRPVDALSQI